MPYRSVPAAFAAAAALVSVALAAEPTRDLNRCDALAKYYDDIGGRLAKGRSLPGRLERDLGYDECRKGDHGAGIRLLEDAIRRNGYDVPKG